jgi:plastocyanin
MRIKLALVLSAWAVAGFGLVACGDDETSTSASTPTGAGVTIAADADGALAFNPSEATVAPGEATVVFDNPSSIPHDLVIEDADGKELARTDVINGDSQEIGFDAEADSYTFYCSVDSHREAGMEGTLAVAKP